MQSLQEATDFVSKKLDDYEWAIRKHGLQTITGMVADILDSSTLAAMAAGGGLLAFISGPVGAVLGTGTIAIGRAALALAERRIILGDLRRGENAPVAAIHEMRRVAAGA
jgi:hypothetical protein